MTATATQIGYVELEHDGEVKIGNLYDDGSIEVKVNGEFITLDFKYSNDDEFGDDDRVLQFHSL